MCQIENSYEVSADFKFLDMLSVSFLNLLKLALPEIVLIWSEFEKNQKILVYDFLQAALPIHQTQLSFRTKPNI